jgi:hypothetical protein
VVPFKVSLQEIETASEIFMSSAFIAFFGQFNRMFQNNHEDPIPVYQELFLAYKLPGFIKRIAATLYELFVSKRMAQSVRCIKDYTAEDIDEIYKLKDRFCNEFYERWQAEKLDAVISPAFFHAAFKASDVKNDIALKPDYTMLWNVLHYPAGIVPVTEVLPGEDQGYEDSYNDSITRLCK